MKVKKFFAGTSREALRQVRQALGPDALILSNRQAAGGVEIMALASADMACLMITPGEQSETRKAGQADSAPAAGGGSQRPNGPAPNAPVAEPMAQSIISEILGADAINVSNRQAASGVEIMARASADTSCLMGAPGQQPEWQKAGQADAAPAAGGERRQLGGRAPNAPVAEPMAQNIISEIQTMRGMLEEQLATLAWGDMTRREPAKANVLRTMLGAGFSSTLSRHLVDKLPAGCDDQEQNLQRARAALAGSLHTADDDEITDRGGVYALVGPTGVGKTTTAAKLAARCVVRHGADKVALLTIDSYRIGGHEQLRIYGKLLGVPVRAINDAEDLQLTLSELRGKHMVLIDTVGMSQRDQMVAEQVAMLSNSGCDVKRMLLLNAAGSGDTLDDVVQAYQGNGLHGCIITKVDEAASLGAVLDTVIRRKLVLHYVANGQKVPEDLHLANLRYLLHRAFRPAPGDSPFALQEAEFALVMAGAGKLDGGVPFDASASLSARLSAGASHG